jgi:penicillin-binding protein 2
MLTLKDHIKESALYNQRMMIAIFAMVLLTGLLIFRLFHLQIINHQHFSMLSESNRVYLQPVPPIRGLIYDRNGTLLADNRPTYNLQIVPYLIKDMKATLDRLQQFISIDPEHRENFMKRLLGHNKFDRLTLLYDLDQKSVAKFSVNRHLFTGIDINSQLTRIYPHKQIAGHLIGYVARINKQDLNTINHKNYRSSTHIGRIGIERFYEKKLHGNVGYQQVEVNVKGRVLRTLNNEPAIQGDDIYLTLDIRLQKIAEQALGEKTGAIVGLDVKTGEVLILASTPNYDPNDFVNGISQKKYDLLRNSPKRPLFNRAVQGQYPPGSTIKPMVGLAGLELDIIKPDNTISCAGWYKLPTDKRKYRDWKKSGHGHVNLDDSIMQSCDVFFYDLAYALGIKKMSAYLKNFGLGATTGLDFPVESRGIVPNKEWKRQHHNQSWYHGDTLISGIGQGYMLTTPLQLAVATATLANRGLRQQPHLLYASRIQNNSEQLSLNETSAPPQVPIYNSKNWDYVINSMKNVVHHKRGTARKIKRGLSVTVAGKTGTAQVFGIKQDETYNADEIPEHLKDHALFIAFTPVENPLFALSVIVEHGGGGSSTAAPIAKKIIQAYSEMYPI